jgi:hypothetical protein
VHASPQPAQPRARGRSSRSRSRIEELEGDETAIVGYFKERVYASFTGLAIVLVVAAAAEPDADHAFWALLLGVLGISAAGFVSDVISHLAVHREFPDRRGWLILLRISGGAFGTVITPLILIGLAWAGILPIEVALTAASIVYLVTLAVIGWFAVRRSRLPWWEQLIALLLLVALGLVVLGLQTLAHSVSGH